MSTFTLSPATAISNVVSLNNQNSKIRNGNNNNNRLWTLHYIYFIGALFCVMLAISQQQQQSSSSPLFLGTAVTAAVTATVSSVRPASVTMMAMTAGGRTLIEIGNNNNGRPNVDDDDDKKKEIDDDASSSSTKSDKLNPLLQKTFQAIKNPIVASIVIGNVASMIGLLPIGLSGFLPALSIAIFGRRLKTMKWLSKPLMLVLKNSKGFVATALKNKKKVLVPYEKIRSLVKELCKFISKLYKNDCWYVHHGDEK
ncbi:hypothetical protein FRACYDRAFT_246825 [Fragilariopsis cylindrus CCMP1102]|uniref:Transmembrane protein n=1 Tax=Fragilariopsis cylindrus CCMP1102 TaxID=635003 RepID=A0A1E7EY50_9STRA|nr:hypothetical protein FRACYDRAFT_246825 [Fragilariopsis cylindrus CCMP1102]|eukprot:OEU10950.1 hypothetical protein FRACYDRAFT_246825 [Fragilariopsis cylindrus CCMP1102]